MVWAGVSPETVGDDRDETPERRLHIAILMSLHEDARENAKLLKPRLARFKGYAWTGGPSRIPEGAGRICSLLMDAERLCREARMSPRIKELCQMVGVMHSAFAEKIEEMIGEYSDLGHTRFWLMAKRSKGERVRAGTYSQLANPRLSKRLGKKNADGEPVDG